MKTGKKIASLLLSCVLLLGIAAGCSNPGSTTQTPGTATTTSSGTTPTPPEKVSVTVWGHDMDFPQGDRLVAYLEEKFNLDLTFVSYPQGQYQENLRVELSAGKVPDMFATMGPGDTNTMYDQVQSEGLLQDLTDVLPNYPNLNAQLSYDPDMIYTLKNDDRIFGVPRIWNKNTTDRVFMIRQDWLEELNLKMPDTWEDLYKVLLAFKEAKPDGQEQVGLTTNHWAWLDMLVYPGFTGAAGWYKDANGVYQDATLHPGRKTAVEYLAKLYKDGVLDPEIYVHNDSRPLDYFSSGRSGVVMQTSQYASCLPYFEQTTKNFPDAKIAIINPLMESPDGIRAHWGIDSGYYGMWVFSKNFKHTDRMLEMMDWIASEEGNKFVRNGIEGVHYTVENGKIVKNEAECEKDQFNSNGVTSHYLSYFTSIDFTFNRDMTLPYAADIFVPSDEIGAKYSVKNPVQGLPYDDRMTANNAAIQDILSTYTSQIITGQMSIDKYDEMLQKIKDIDKGYMEEKVNEYMKSKGQ